MKPLSPHISYDEATYTHTGLKNDPNELQWANMKEWAFNVFEPLRIHFGKPIFINSLFRSVEVNNHQDVRGSRTSDHLCNGDCAAGDIDNNLKSPSNLEIFNYIKDNLKYKQLIAEFPVKGSIGWVHVSNSKSNNKCEILISIKNKDGETQYKPYSKELLDKLMS